MSNFLGNLVERSLFAVGTVRPQLFSIFEPPLVNGVAFFRSTENPEVPAVEQHHQDPADRISRLQSLWPTNPEAATEFLAATSKPGLTSPESTELPSASQQIPTRADLPGKQQSAVPSREHRAPANGTKKDEEGAGALRPELCSGSQQIQTLVSGKQQSAVPSREDRAPADCAKKDEKGAGALRSQLPSQHTPSPSGANKPVPCDPTKNRPHELRAERIIEMISPERDAHHELTRTRDLHAVSQRPPSLRSLISPQQPKSSPVEPSINVTIGRIEVRATLPPASAKTQRPAAPILSLDEYLHQRAGGNRR